MFEDFGKKLVVARGEILATLAKDDCLAGGFEEVTAWENSKALLVFKPTLLT